MLLSGIETEATIEFHALLNSFHSLAVNVDFARRTMLQVVSENKTPTITSNVSISWERFFALVSNTIFHSNDPKNKNNK